MLDGICPKCDSKTVYHHKHHLRETMIRIGFFARSYVENLVCSSCGFVEQYILDSSSLHSIERSWLPVKHQKSRPEKAIPQPAGFRKNTDVTQLPLLIFLLTLFATALFLMLD